MSDLVAMDLVPEPSIVAAALRACRRLEIKPVFMMRKIRLYMTVPKKLMLNCRAVDPHSH